MAVMQSLLVNIKSVGADNARMKDALSTILACLQRQSGRRAPPLQTYTITSFDIDFGARVGRGGFSEVFRGKWRGSEIAVKVLDRRVSERMILREVKVWNELRHPHVVRECSLRACRWPASADSEVAEMFGASVYEDPPFIVMPLMRYGDVLAYLQDHNPNADRRSLVRPPSVMGSSPADDFAGRPNRSRPRSPRMHASSRASCADRPYSTHATSCTAISKRFALSRPFAGLRSRDFAAQRLD